MDSFTKWLADLLKQPEVQVERFLRDKDALHFLIAWSIFESKCFTGFLRATDLYNFSKRISDEGFEHETISSAANHFHQRYQDSERLRNLLHDKTPQKVTERFKQVLSKNISDITPSESIYLVSVVVYRFRNNIFHGRKKVDSWLRYGEQIRICTESMQHFIRHAESRTVTMEADAA
ncbi:hypothetical protein [Thauera butanivorans]|uniref:hypothetical protein n=1 Tax=Thauera butanivorans TaxID=86174 RepID=UPI0012F8BB47|nr:hypothetical protein [Thauera butanivorans]